MKLKVPFTGGCVCGEMRFWDANPRLRRGLLSGALRAFRGAGASFLFAVRNSHSYPALDLNRFLRRSRS